MRLIILLISFASLLSHAMPLMDFLQKPKLVVVIVIDQFRADYLTRFHERFVKPGQEGQAGGFLLLMKDGAYFPFAEYDVLQNMTCPGHAMIMTGSTPDLMGVPLNQWYDRKTKKTTYCIEDAKDGLSPRNLKTTTVGDELKNAGVPSKIIGIALKDRSAIMLAGHRADHVMWFDDKNSQWITSTFYEKGLPSWIAPLNQELKNEKGQAYLWKTSKFEKKTEKGSKQALRYPYGTEILFKAAMSALETEKLGQNKGTDILVLSLSNHDYLGHALGPNAPELEELTVVEDLEVSKFLTKIKKQMGGFDNVVVALTADHGIPPLVSDLKAAKIDSGKIDYDVLNKKINEALNKKFGASKNRNWIAASKFFHFWLNPDILSNKKLDSEKVEEEVRKVIMQTPGVLTAFTRSDALKNKWPVGIIGEQLKKQYLPSMSGDVVLIPLPFFSEADDNHVTHMTGYTYDRQVPLILMGSKIKAGVYTEPAKIIDLAPTLSFILGTIAPAASQGRVLQIF